jgi:D-glycero-alpha-D-manno-heptose-7-phosphate kinase
MIITRTPFRISFFGGGTDYPAWYRNHGGAVLATTIDKYCYITARRLPPFFEHKHRIVYSKIERVQSNSEIEHPAVRALLTWANIEEGLEIHHDGDLPARAGLGSSSAFTVGLAHALHSLNGRMVSQEQLAKEAIHIEQNIIGESVGSQDQISAAYGGLNRIDFHRDDSFSVSPLVITPTRCTELRDHLMLCFTGLSRTADLIAKSTIEKMAEREAAYKKVRSLVDEAVEVLTNRRIKIDEFGELLDMSWQQKRTFSDSVTSPLIDSIYEVALRSGAIGGKLLGAGGGGFMLLFAKPEKHAAIRESLKNLVHVSFNFDNLGSKVVLYQPNGL